MVSQISLDCDICVGPENLGNKDGNSFIPSSSHQEHPPAQNPLKRQTRRWAAWTREEEESFFAALRQVGKNFEKITCRVQSKNKDQVRHYYYRLVRRMNKLLGPELCLDAKNSKETNAAMLRWWSLLEKYSCKASKLHLKPRRFKMFVEALEHQLLKDRKKNTKKRLPSGEINTYVSDISTSNQVRQPSHDSRAEKMVIVVDRLNLEKAGTSKRNVNVGVHCKVDQSSAKTAKPRRRTGPCATAAYKRWEKAAIAGVSLVADAAEHLERANTKKGDIPENPGQGDIHLDEEVAPTFQISPKRLLIEDNKSTKLKLQLFPIDEWTRKALEMVQHNPHLELTLSTRKRISSVVEHLSRKWGNSSTLSGELILFPYSAQRENLFGCQKWAKDSPLCAGDVYYQIGSPSIFRLRYGWFSKSEIESVAVQPLPYTSEGNLKSSMVPETENESSPQISQFVAAPPFTSTPMETGELVSSTREDIGNLAIAGQVENMKGPVLSSGEWADTLVDISMGDLLSESSPNMEFPMPLGSSSLEQHIPFTCDSFDAAIAAHIYKHQNSVNLQQNLTPHMPSIWDAEETCDAFAFRKIQNENPIMKDCIKDKRNTTLTGAIPSENAVEELPKEQNIENNISKLDLPSENSNKGLGLLSDIYWPDSLGPLDLDIPSCRYHSHDLILSDSLGGSSAFQSCSLFAMDGQDRT